MPKTYDEKQANECGGWPPPEEKLGQPAQQGCQPSAAAVKASVPVPQISMIEKTDVRKSLPPKAFPFRTGLLARMQAVGGVRAAKPQPPVDNWIDQLLKPIFG